MDILTQKTKKNIYGIYFLVIAFLFIIIFLDILSCKINFAKLHLKLNSKTIWLIALIIVVITSYIDLSTGVLLGILLFAVSVLQKRENFTSSTEFDTPYTSVKTKVVDRLINQIKNQNPNMDLDDNYYNYLYDKYFNNADILEKLTEKESRKLVSDFKSNHLIPYNLAEEEKLKQSRANWSRIGIS